MFCSFCKNLNFEDVHESRRKICPVGHIACEDCDVNLKYCPECKIKFSNYVSIEFANNIPRLFISNFPPSSETESASNLARTSSETDSIKQILDQIKECEERRNFKEEEKENPIIGFFEVLGEVPQSSDIQFSVDSEEERAIMKCFAVCDKKEEVIKKPEPSKIPTLKPQIPKSAHRLTNRGIQTSVMKLPSESTSKKFSSISSRDLYRNDDSEFQYASSINSESATVLELFKNQNAVDGSETAHFTSLTVSLTGASPPDSPPKSISSLAHRVKFTSFYDGFQQIPPQMEPMMIYEIETSSSTESLPTDVARKLPRFPVRCPITNCSSFNVPSDFCNHITIDHPQVDVIKVSPGKLFNMNLNHKGNSGMVVCQRLVLLSEKITDIGYGVFENCLPIVLLTSKMSYRKAFGFPTSTNVKPSDENFFIWLQSVYQFPVNFTITLFSHARDDFEPTIIKSMTSSAVFMNHQFNPKEIAANSFSLSNLELQKVTKNGKKMLSCQILLH